MMFIFTPDLALSCSLRGVDIKLHALESLKKKRQGVALPAHFLAGDLYKYVDK